MEKKIIKKKVLDEKKNKFNFFSLVIEEKFLQEK